MLEWMIKGQVIYVLIFLMGGLGFISIFISGIVYSSLVKASEDMAFTESSLLKQIKLKYTNCFKLELYTHEVQAFINKSLFKKKILKCPLYIWEHLGLEMMYMTMILGLLGTFMHITYYQKNGSLPFNEAFISGLLGFGLATALLIIRVVFAIEAKKQIFYSNVIDYLENHLKNKLEQQYKKEDVYETIETMDTMEEQDKSDNKMDKKTKKSSGNHFSDAKSLSATRSEQEEKAVESLQEGLIEDVINQVMSH